MKREVTAGDKAGQWSARKSQLATHEYQYRGDTYVGRKSADNSLATWTEGDWDTKSGKESGETGERYPPREARESLADEE